MKNIFFLLLFAAFAWTSCKNDGEGVKEIRSSGGPNANIIRNPASADEPLDTNQLARMTYGETEFDFGTVKEGEIVIHSFPFTNTGKVPLIISNARSTCGCTIPEWPEEPVPPGGTGEIKARFNTSGKKESQRKVITVTANTYPNESTVVLKGMVAPE